MKEPLITMRSTNYSTEYTSETHTLLPSHTFPCRLTLSKLCFVKLNAQKTHINFVNALACPFTVRREHQHSAPILTLA